MRFEEWVRVASVLDGQEGARGGEELDENGHGARPGGGAAIPSAS